MTAAPPAIRVATRGSPLARWQADRVAELLVAKQPDLEVDIVVVVTGGDRRLDVSIAELGGKGAFVAEVQRAVLDGGADIAVHSAKDMPAVSPPGLVLAAVPERADPRDAMVGSTLDAIPPGGRVATGSPRRRAQLAHVRPDLTFAGLRGNLGTRLEKAAAHHAAVVAAAALDRLGWSDRAAERLAVDVVVPQVGQGALAVECRVEDERSRDRLAAIDHPAVRPAVDAERAFLAELGGDCDLPAGAYATLGGGGVTIRAYLGSLDGRIALQHVATDTDPVAAGRDAAVHLLDTAGGRDLLPPF